MTPPVLIGLAGPKQAGKNTTANIIDELCPDKVVVQRGFADLLKWSAYRIFKPDCTMQEAIEWADHVKMPVHRGVPGSILEHDAWCTIEFYDIDDREGCPSLELNGREFLQRYGTECHRDIFDSNFWIDALLPRVEEWWIKNFSGADIALITDVRFPNEAKRILDLRGTVVEIQRTSDGVDDTHASEQPLHGNHINISIMNTGTLDDLREQVDGVLHRLRLL